MALTEEQIREFVHGHGGLADEIVDVLALAIFEHIEQTEPADLLPDIGIIHPQYGGHLIIVENRGRTLLVYGASRGEGLSDFEVPSDEVFIAYEQPTSADILEMSEQRSQAAES